MHTIFFIPSPTRVFSARLAFVAYSTLTHSHSCNSLLFLTAGKPKASSSSSSSSVASPIPSSPLRPHKAATPSASSLLSSSHTRPSTHHPATAATHQQPHLQKPPQPVCISHILYPVSPVVPPFFCPPHTNLSDKREKRQRQRARKRRRRREGREDRRRNIKRA